MPRTAYTTVATALVRLLQMGDAYGGILSEVGIRLRDGSTGCPSCNGTGFEPLRFERWVRCTGCATVFRQRRAVTVVDVLGDAWREFRGGEVARSQVARSEVARSDARGNGKYLLPTEPDDAK